MREKRAPEEGAIETAPRLPLVIAGVVFAAAAGALVAVHATRDLPAAAGLLAVLLFMLSWRVGLGDLTAVEAVMVVAAVAVASLLVRPTIAGALTGGELTLAELGLAVLAVVVALMVLAATGEPPGTQRWRERRELQERQERR